MKNKSLILGSLLLTTCNQAQHAPFIDTAFSHTDDGRRFKGWAILLFPWRRNEHGESLIQRALVIGWQVQLSPVSGFRNPLLLSPHE